MGNAKVAIGVPHLGPLPGFFTDSLLGQTSRDGGIYTLRVENKPVDLARNKIVQGFLESDATHLFFMDADMVFPAGTLQRLLAHDLPIVSGTYFARTDTPVPHVYRYVREDEFGERWYHPMGEEFVAWLKAHPEQAKFKNAHLFDEPHLVECDGLGGGCLLVKREVFERIPEPWFKNAEGSAGGEDFDFCEKAKAAGYPIYADFAVQCDHEVRTFTGREEFIACFGIGQADEHDFREPLVVQVGPNGSRKRVAEGEYFRFPYDVEGYLSPEEGRSLFRLALQCPPDGQVVELGSYKGRSAICLAQSGRPLLCVDHGLGEALPGKTLVHDDHRRGCYLDDLRKNLERYVPTADVQVWAKSTTAAAEGYLGRKLVSLLFVDAAHDYESVHADVRAWLPHLAYDGVIAFDDTNFPGVARVINELVDGGWAIVHQQDALTALRRDH